LTRRNPVRDQLTARLSELEQEYEIGERRLLEIDAQQARLRETLLRLSGAIQVLHELLDASSPNGRATATDSTSEHVPEAR
jgi:predicted nuclease with TOPRIM domain